MSYNKKQSWLARIVPVLFVLGGLLEIAGVAVYIYAEDGTDAAASAYAAFRLGVIIVAFCWGYELGQRSYKKKEE